MRGSVGSGLLAAIMIIAAVMLSAPAASSAVDADTCANAEFRTGWSANLQDCRAYELVTQTEFKKGQSLQVSAAPSPAMATPAPTGDRLLWAIVTPVGDSVGSTESYVAASRESDGWKNHAITPKACSQEVYGELNPSYSISRVAVDLSSALWLESYSPNCDDPNDQAGKDIYMTDPFGQKHWISQNGNVKTANVNPLTVGASADLSHVFFSTTEQLVPAVDAGRVASATGIYERFNGQTRAVGVDNDGQALNICGAKAAAGTVTPSDTSRSKVSPDGRIIYFAAGTSGDPSCSVADGGGQLYARIDGQRTVPISASELSTPTTPTVAPTMTGATEDGLTAYFSSKDQLTDDATPGGGLYRYDLRSVVQGDAVEGELTFLTPQTANPNGPTIGRFVGASEDGTVVYFRATGDLAPGAPTGEATYRYDSDGVALVTDNQGGISWFDASVSRSGRWLAYRGEHANGTRQIYLYDSDSAATPVCVSCPESGAPGSDAASWIRDPGDGTSRLTDRRIPWVTEEGQVFFTTPERLLPEDVNEVNDVYEYHSGRFKLISAGKASRYGSVMTGTARDGRDVFFATTDTLLASDRDNGDDDIYVARVGGGFVQPQPSEAPCVGDDCQGAPGAAPSVPFIGSVGFGAEPIPPRSETPRAAMRIRRMNARTGAVARLRVRVPSAGQIVVAGRAVRRARRAAPRAGAYQVRVALTPRARRVLRQRGAVRVAARIAYRARGGGSAARRVGFVFRMPARAGR